MINLPSQLSQPNDTIAEIFGKLTSEELAVLQTYYLAPVPVTTEPIVKKKKPFNKAEDEQLRQLVEKHGENWSKISSEMPSRSVKQCRERWTHYLSPNLNRSEWTEEEDAKLKELVGLHGTKWALISKSFNRRTDTAVKNRWLVLLRKQASNIPSQQIQIIDTLPELAPL